MFDRYSVFVHAASVAREKQKDGGTLVKVWTARNYEPPFELNGMKVGSAKVLVTINCTRHIYDAAYTVYSTSNLGGSSLPLAYPHNLLLNQPVEPETFEFALQDKYCSSWAFWR